MISQSIVAFLQPHTSSPSMPLIAHMISSLFASDFGGGDLNQVLSAHLDSLGISPQAKQNIIPALLGITKLAKLQLQQRLKWHLVPSAWSHSPRYLLARPHWFHYNRLLYLSWNLWAISLNPPVCPPLLIRCTSNRSLPTPVVVTLSGTLANLIQAFCFCWASPKPRPDTSIFILIRLGMSLNIGCLAQVINGNAFHQGWSILSTTIAFLLYVAMGNQAGLLGHRLPPWKPGKRRRYETNQSNCNDGLQMWIHVGWNETVFSNCTIGLCISDWVFFSVGFNWLSTDKKRG